MLFFGGGEYNNVESNLGKYFSAGGPSGPHERVEVRPYKKNHLTGLWVTTNDHRDDKQKWQIYQPFWKWEGIRPIMQFGKKEAISENPDADKEAAPENTLFNTLYKEERKGREGAYYGVPLFHTSMTLAPSEAGGIGQSLLMKNEWGSHTSKSYWNYLTWVRKARSIPSLGAPADYLKTSALPPVQGMWATIQDIPYPLPNNIGAITQTLAESGAMGGGDQRVAFPEININMMINSLLPSPAVDLKENSNVGDNCIVYGDISSASSVTGGTSLRSVTGDADMWKHNKSFWRSVIITFSNYKPAELLPLSP